MTALLRIHALVRAARFRLFVGMAAGEISLACLRRAGRLLDEASAWCDARDAIWRRATP
jgi:hypothetical protein